jgi:protocatechuate 4,5-dioxygenase alpha chain
LLRAWPCKPETTSGIVENVPFQRQVCVKATAPSVAREKLQVVCENSRIRTFDSRSRASRRDGRGIAVRRGAQPEWCTHEEANAVAWNSHDYDKVPGTYVFNGRRASIGYPLNRMCMSFNRAENREAFRQDEDAYCERYGLTPEQRQAIRARDVLRLVQLGGHIYYLAKFAGIDGLNVQDLGARQRGMHVDAFKTMLVKSGE